MSDLKVQFRNIDSMLRMIQFVRSKHPEMDLEIVHLFLLICVNPHMNASDYVEYFGKPKSTISRWLKVLRKELKWIDLKENPQDTRRKNIELTEEGKNYRNWIELELTSEEQ